MLKWRDSDLDWCSFLIITKQNFSADYLKIDMRFLKVRVNEVDFAAL